MYTQLWIYFYQHMNMIRHYFYFKNFKLQFLGNLICSLFKCFISIIDQYFATVFSAPDHMILTTVNDIFIALVHHVNIIPRKAV